MKSSGVNQEWQYSTVHNSARKVIEEQALWGQTVRRVWLPNQDAVVRAPRSALRPLSADLQPEIEARRIACVAAASQRKATEVGLPEVQPVPSDPLRCRGDGVAA